MESSDIENGKKLSETKNRLRQDLHFSLTGRNHSGTSEFSTRCCFQSFVHEYCTYLQEVQTGLNIMYVLDDVFCCSRRLTRRSFLSENFQSHL